MSPIGHMRVVCHGSAILRSHCRGRCVGTAAVRFWVRVAVGMAALACVHRLRAGYMAGAPFTHRASHHARVPHGPHARLDEGTPQERFRELKTGGMHSRRANDHAKKGAYFCSLSGVGGSIVSPILHVVGPIYPGVARALVPLASDAGGVWWSSLGALHRPPPHRNSTRSG